MEWLPAEQLVEGSSPSGPVWTRTLLGSGSILLPKRAKAKADIKVYIVGMSFLAILRRILYALAAAVFVSSVFIPLNIRDAYPHGVGESFRPPSVKLDSEQFSDQTVETGGVFKISGTLVSVVSSQEFRLSPYVSVDTGNPFYPLDLNGFPRLYYPLHDSTDSWYFRIESNLPNPIVLKPGEKLIMKLDCIL